MVHEGAADCHYRISGIFLFVGDLWPAALDGNDPDVAGFLGNPFGMHGAGLLFEATVVGQRNYLPCRLE